MSEMVNINRQDICKQELFIVLDNFSKCKGVLRPNCLRNAGLVTAAPQLPPSLFYGNLNS